MTSTNYAEQPETQNWKAHQITSQYTVIGEHGIGKVANGQATHP